MKLDTHITGEIHGPTTTQDEMATNKSLFTKHTYQFIAYKSNRITLKSTENATKSTKTKNLKERWRKLQQ